jgi:uncharacterized membrane-anchored protein
VPLWLTALLFAIALGTAAGDLLAESLNLGYLLSLVVFAAVIAVEALAYYAVELNAVVAFWIAYILTRPLGASTGDLLLQSPKDGGVGLGITGTSVLFLAVILLLVVGLSANSVVELNWMAPPTSTCPRRSNCVVFRVLAPGGCAIR